MDIKKYMPSNRMRVEAFDGHIFVIGYLGWEQGYCGFMEDETGRSVSGVETRKNGSVEGAVKSLSDKWKLLYADDVD